MKPVPSSRRGYSQFPVYYASNSASYQKLHIFPTTFPHPFDFSPHSEAMWKIAYSSAFPQRVFHINGVFFDEISNTFVENHVESVEIVLMGLYSAA